METKLFKVDVKLNKVVDSMQHGKQIQMLHSLYTGLRSLYEIIKAKENWAAENYPSPNLLQGYDYMNEGKVESEFFKMLPNYHHWFSVSLVNYVRLAGFLSGMADGKYTKEDQKTKQGRNKIKDYCNNYVDVVEELVDVKQYRNIVSAHFALTDPRKDNFLTMDISATNICGFRDNRIVSKAGIHVNIDIRNQVPTSQGEEPDYSKQVTTVEEIPIWSITQVFEELHPRYWPDKELPVEKYQLNKIPRGEKFNFQNGVNQRNAVANIQGKSRIVKP